MCAGISVPVLLCCNQLKKNLVIGWGKMSSQRTLFTRNQCQWHLSLSLCLCLSGCAQLYAYVHTCMHFLGGTLWTILSSPSNILQYYSILCTCMYISLERKCQHTQQSISFHHWGFISHAVTSDNNKNYLKFSLFPCADHCWFRRLKQAVHGSLTLQFFQFVFYVFCS